MVPKLQAYVTKGILGAHAKFCSKGQKIHDEENNDGSDTDNCAHIRMCMVYGVQNVYHKINCEPMNTEIQGGTNKYDRRTSKWYTIEKKDPAWYAAGINKLIDRYKKMPR